MLAIRRAAVMQPALVRRCSGTAFIQKMKAMETETAKLAATLPDDLKPIAAAGVRGARLPVRRVSCCKGTAACLLEEESHSNPTPPLRACPQGQITADITKFSTERPELYKTVIAKIAEVRRARARKSAGLSTANASPWGRRRPRLAVATLPRGHTNVCDCPLADPCAHAG